VVVDHVQGTASALKRQRRTLGDPLISALLVLLAVAFTGFFASLLPSIADGRAYRFAWPWVPSLKVSLSFYLDGLSLLFTLLVSAIGAIVFLYTGAYARGDRHFVRLHAYLGLFMVAMLGLVLADNLITLLVFWELTTLASYLLIGFDHEDPKARAAALQALLVTNAGGLALFAGFILLGSVGGSFELSELRTNDEAVRAHALYGPILALVLCGAFTKSAQVPFHFWLPRAMAAPTPVSAYLHSATMVQAGVYLLARLHPVLAGTDAWLLALTGVGAITAVLGSLLALRQTDLKLLLAYSTIMGLGTLVMFLGAEAPIAVAAAMTFLIVHALYKSSLFLVAGVIEHAAGTRDLRRLGGLARAMPLTALAACVAALSMAGFPPFLGFVGKELRYEGALAIAGGPVAIVAAAVAANAMMVAAAGMIVLGPFFGRRADLPRRPHEGPARMWLAPLALASLGLALGMSPGLTETLLVQPAVVSVLREPVAVELALWHGLNLPLLLSILTIVLGIAIYRWRRPVGAGLAMLAARLPISAEGTYEAALDGLMRLARRYTLLLQTGSLTRYIAVVFATFGLAVGATLIARGGFAPPAAWPDLPGYEWAVVALIAAGTLTTVFTSSRLAAICALSMIGIGLALLFLIYGAPDLAMTQLLVDTLFVVMMAIVLLSLPPLAGTKAPRRLHQGHACLALLAGTVVAALVYAAASTPIDPFVSRFFEARSLDEAHGRNVVNIILVDFRALDTFGEITVVAVAGLAAFALIRTGRGRAVGAAGSLILRTASRFLVSLILVFSVLLLLRGHDAPGGGFIGGLIAAIAFVLYSIAYGPGAVLRTLRTSPRSVALAGIGLALLAGMAAALAGEPFLSGLWTQLGGASAEDGIWLGTPLVFDVGVYLVVVGTVLTLVLALEEKA
jgi:multicomponent Na+:H+ antiporter subunit A